MKICTRIPSSIVHVDEEGSHLVKEAILTFISTRGGSDNARHRVLQASWAI